MNPKTRGSTGPRRNAGGNPYIPKGDGNASVQAYIAAMPGWKRAIGRRLDALVEEHLPGVRKAVRWNTPFYGIEGQGWFLAFYCYRRYVQVTFLNGAQLEPMPPKPSKVENVRYLEIHEHGDIAEERLADWIEQAAALPGERVF